MSIPPGSGPGWYPDPASGNRIRHWDGTRWTEEDRVTAYDTGYDPYAAASQPPYTGPSNASSGGSGQSDSGPVNPYGGLAAPADARAATWERSPTGTSGPPQQAPAGGWAPAGPTPAGSPYQPYQSNQPGYHGTAGQPGYDGTAGQPGYHGTAGQPGFQPAPYASPSTPYASPYAAAPRRGGGRAIIFTVIAAVVVLALALGVWLAVRGSGAPPEASGEVEIGVPLSGSVPDGEGWSSTLTVDSAGLYRITATSDEDLTLTLYDDGGSISENDDNGGVLGDSWLDPVIITYLEPGEYVVEVDTYGSGSADAELLVSAETDAAQLTMGSTTAVTIPAGEYWIGFAEIDPETAVAVDVQAAFPGDDLVMLVGSDGATDKADDRESGEGTSRNDYDPYLETGRTGFVAVLVAPYGGDAGRAVTPASR